MTIHLSQLRCLRVFIFMSGQNSSSRFLCRVMYKEVLNILPSLLLPCSPLLSCLLLPLLSPPFPSHSLLSSPLLTDVEWEQSGKRNSMYDENEPFYFFIVT